MAPHPLSKRQHKTKNNANPSSHPSEVSVSRMGIYKGCMFPFQHFSQLFAPPYDLYFQVRSGISLTIEGKEEWREPPEMK